SDGPVGITAGPDRALWFTNTTGNSIGRIDPTTHAITNYTDPIIDGPVGITAGPDRALWFTNTNGSSIGRISAFEEPRAPTTTTAPLATPPAAVQSTPNLTG
ncbi:MAG: virginiamycin B lyase family protein, partial [Acidimicrobiales bacterium]